MKTHTMMLVLLLAAAFAARAQTPPPDALPPPGDGRDWEEPAPGPELDADAPPPGETAAPTGHPTPRRPEGGPPIQQFLDMLKQRNPAEFERMRALREENPEAFREELRNRIRDERERRGGPAAMPAWKRGPEHAGHAIAEGGVRQAMAGETLRSPELDRLERNAAELARALREAKTDEEKSRARADLRAALANVFDAREAMRRERFQRMEAQLGKVREMLDKRQAHRDEIIDKRLQSMTEGDALAW